MGANQLPVRSPALRLFNRGIESSPLFFLTSMKQMLQIFKFLSLLNLNHELFSRLLLERRKDEKGGRSNCPGARMQIS